MIQNQLEYADTYDLKKDYYKQLIRLSKETGNEEAEAGFLFDLADIHFWQTDYTLSLSKVQEGISIAGSLKNNELLATGYGLLERLHYMFSPEQAQYYDRRYRQFCEKSDNPDLQVDRFLHSTLVRQDYTDMLPEDLLAIDFQTLSDSHQAKLSFLIARSLLAAGKTEEASYYLSFVNEFLADPQKPYFLHKIILSTMQLHLMAKMSLLLGDIPQAWKYLDQSDKMTRKNKLLGIKTENYKLASEIAQAVNREDMALKYYKKGSALYDSIMNATPNKYFPDELIITLMKHMEEDRGQNQKQWSLFVYISLLLFMFLGFSILYFHKSNVYEKKTTLAMTGIKDRALADFHDRLKNHLMKIMYVYKDGVFYYMKNKVDTIHHPEGITNPYDDLQIYMENADHLLNSLLDWVESQAEIRQEPYDTETIIKQIRDLYLVTLASKRITYHLSVEENLTAFGDKMLFILAMEHLFHKMVKHTSEGSTIYVSGKKDGNSRIVYSVSDPEEKEFSFDKNMYRQRLEKLESESVFQQTADIDFNIFAESIIRNRAKAFLEFNPEIGTIFSLSVASYHQG